MNKFIDLNMVVAFLFGSFFCQKLFKKHNVFYKPKKLGFLKATSTALSLAIRMGKLKFSYGAELYSSAFIRLD